MIEVGDRVQYGRHEAFVNKRVTPSKVMVCYSKDIGTTVYKIVADRELVQTVATVSPETWPVVQVGDPVLDSECCGTGCCQEEN